MGNTKSNVINANHDKVLAVMDRFLAERYKDLCSCHRCRNDIIAIALNYLPPHYVVQTEPGKDFGSPWVMVETAVTEAIDRVMENPNHPRSSPLMDVPSDERSGSLTS